MKRTSELIKKIKKADKKDLRFLTDKDYKCPQIQYYLADLLNEHHISSAEFIRQMNIERSYGYQILNGNRKPSREILIKAAILLQLSLDETQRLLKIGNRNILYPRIKKDAIAVFSIEKGLSLSEYQELMAAYAEEF